MSTGRSGVESGSEALRTPLVVRSLRLDNLESKEVGRGVRSRIVQMISTATHEKEL